MTVKSYLKLLAVSIFSVGSAYAASNANLIPLVSASNLGTLVSLQVRSDGAYDVICKNGQREVANGVQLILGSICPTGSVKTPKFVSIQLVENGNYSVVCADQSHHVVTADQITSGQVCGSSSSTPGSFASLNGHEFFKVKVSGAMSDDNVINACKAVGLNVACNSAQNGDFSDNLCLDIGLKDGGNPMKTLSQQICNGSNPNNCPALDGVYQYMGHKWSGNACGVENTRWCASDGTDRLALCVR